MRIAFLAAGAGGMYCGSCLRDNRLAATLRAQGRDVVLIPLYTPLRVDGADASDTGVYYGGVNVYLEQNSWLFRRLPRFLDRWLASSWLLRRATRRAAAVRAESLGPLTVSVLSGAEGRQRKELEALVEALAALRPALVNLPNLLFAGVARRLRQALRVPIVCTLSGEDIFTTQLVEPYKRRTYELIRRAAADIDAFVAVTTYFANFAAGHFGLPGARVHVVPMGIDAAEFEPASPPVQPFTIGYLARICPEKGLANLVDAFLALRRAGRDCRLRVAGYLGGADRPYFEQQRTRMAAAGQAAAFEYIGEVTAEAKRAFLGGLHAFSVPTVYHEAKGLFILEALAAGVPVVQPAHGSFPELIRDTGGGVTYPPDEPGGLARGLAGLMDDAELRRRLGECGQRSVRSDFTAERMSAQTWALYERLVAGVPAAGAMTMG